MRIGFDARWLHSPEPVAYNRYIISLLRSLQGKASLNLFLFADQRRPIHSSYLEDLDATVISLPRHRELLWDQVQLPLALRRNRIHIYHAPADQGLPAVKVCRYVLTRHSVPYRLYFEHLLRKRALQGTLDDYLGDLRPTHPSLRSLYLRARGRSLAWLSCHRADRIVTVSETTKRELITLWGVPEQKVRVTYLAPGPEFRTLVSKESLERTRRKYGLPESYMLSVGTVAKIKNTDGLLRVFAAVKRAGEVRPLVLCAPTTHDLDFYRTLAAQLGLREQVDIFFLIRVGAELPALYQGAILFILLSWYESFSLPLVEAMASGLPIIVSNHSCLPEILGDGGISVDPRDTNELILTVRRVLEDPLLQQQLRRRALERSDYFSWGKTAQETLQVYEEVVSALREPTAS